MSPWNQNAKRHFTEAARAAAKAAKAAKRAAPDRFGEPEMFVVRHGNGFVWEIRRFGGVILDRGEGGLPSVQQAHSAGVLALATLALL